MAVPTSSGRCHNPAMKKTWGIIGAVVVLAAAGTGTALVMRGGGTTDYKSLPACDKLSAAVPGKPAFKVDQNVTDPADTIHGLHPAFTNIRCQTDDAATSVEVDLYEASNMDPFTMNPYSDRQVHDGNWRANDVLSHHKLSFQLKPGIAYGTLSYVNATCTVEQVKGNADVMLTVPMPETTTVAQFKAKCEQVAEKQMPKVIDAAL